MCASGICFCPHGPQSPSTALRVCLFLLHRPSYLPWSSSAAYPAPVTCADSLVPPPPQRRARRSVAERAAPLWVPALCEAPPSPLTACVSPSPPPSRAPVPSSSQPALPLPPPPFIASASLSQRTAQCWTCTRTRSCELQRCFPLSRGLSQCPLVVPASPSASGTRVGVALVSGRHALLTARYLLLELSIRNTTTNNNNTRKHPTVHDSLVRT